jgi:hypothetical protein
MKVALLLTGFPRTYKRTFDNLKSNILDVHDVDTYICTWDKCQLKSGQPPVDVDMEDLINTYQENLFSYRFINYEKYNANRFESIQFLDRPWDVFKTDPRAIEHGSYWVERLRDQWYIVKESFSMIHRPERYDLIMRLRFDIDLIDIKLDSTKELVIPKDIGGWSYSDHFVYGRVPFMKKYCNVFDEFYRMYEEYNIDISHAVDLLKFYMTDYKTSVNTFTDETIRYTIIK